MDALGVTGRALWDSLHEGRVVSASQDALIVNACRIADRLDELAGQLLRSPLTVENSRGDQIANPLMTEHRQQLLALRQVLSGLGVKELEPAGSGRTNLVDELRAKRAARGVSGG